MGGFSVKFKLKDRFSIFIRSLSLQGSWNFPRMQGLGFFYCLVPWLSKVSGDGFKDACHRHLGYFNTNPYMASYVLGAVSRLEEEGLGQDSVRVRNNLMGPLGAMGDGYYWATLLPVAILLALAVSMFSIIAAPVVFLLVFNSVQLRNRWIYLIKGYHSAHSALQGAASLNNKTFSRSFDRLSMPMMGFILGLSVFRTGTPGTALLVFLCAVFLFRRRWKTPAVFALLAGLGIILGFLGTEMGLPWSG